MSFWGYVISCDGCFSSNSFIWFGLSHWGIYLIVGGNKLFFSPFFVIMDMALAPMLGCDSSTLLGGFHCFY